MNNEIKVPNEIFMSWHELMKGNGLAKLKSKDYTAYALLHHQRYGFVPKGASMQIDDVRMAYYLIALQSAGQLPAVAEMKMSDQSAFTTSNNISAPAELSMTYEVLMSNGGMAKLKAKDYTAYAAMFQSKHGVLPKGNERNIDRNKLSVYASAINGHSSKGMVYAGGKIGKTNNNIPAELYMKYDVLMSNGGMAKLLAKDVTAYAAMFQSKHGVLPKKYERDIDRSKLSIYVKAIAEGEDGNIKNVAIPEELFMSFDELAKNGKLEEIKANNYTLYVAILEENFGGYPVTDAERSTIDWQILTVYKEALRQRNLQELEKLTFQELLDKGLTNKYKEVNIEGYIEKFETHYGVRPPGM